MPCLASALLFPACGSETDTTIASPTTTPATAAKLPPTTTVPPSTVPDDSGEGDVRRERAWKELLGALTSPEQACVRDAVGAALASVSQDENLTGDRVELLEAQVLSCLPTQVAAALFASGLISLLEERGRRWSEEQEACLESVVSGMDVVAPVRGASLLLECIPGLAVTGGEDQDWSDDYPDEITGRRRLRWERCGGRFGGGL